MLRQPSFVPERSPSLNNLASPASRYFLAFPIEFPQAPKLNPVHDDACATASGEEETFRRCAHDG